MSTETYQIDDGQKIVLVKTGIIATGEVGVIDYGYRIGVYFYSNCPLFCDTGIYKNSNYTNVYDLYRQNTITERSENSTSEKAKATLRVGAQSIYKVVSV